VLVLDTQGELSVAMSTRISILLMLIAACNFPRPPDVMPPDGMTEPADASPNACSSDPDCSDTTPVCIDKVCAVCRASTSCPASAPVCDELSHDCRACVKDSECESGACDLAAGTCVERGAIRYVSPRGGPADPCTQTSPCSFMRVGDVVDSDHPVVVLLPGIYLTGASFEGKSATIVGGGATIAISDTQTFGLDINNSDIRMRDLVVDDYETQDDPDHGQIISVSNSTVTIDNMRASSSHVDAIDALTQSSITIRHSVFINRGITINGYFVADDCLFLEGGPRIGGSAQITNSVIIGGSSQAIDIASHDPTHIRSEFANNTFIGGDVKCDADASAIRTFTNNILLGQRTISSAGTGCQYNYNLVTDRLDSGALVGVGNTTGDPMFVDAAAGDFHLMRGSPAIDAGDPAAPLSGRDADGTLRPQGTRSDIGAFEYVPAP
jgi:hypothetical protein